MSKGESLAKLRSIVGECCVELFEAYDVALTPQPDEQVVPLDELVLSGIIGFTGDKLQGSLVLCATRSLLESPNFANSCSNDWIAELSNQLLGRIKNRLLSFGITIYLSTPITMRGHDLKPSTSHPGSEPLHLRGLTEGAVVWFDVDPPEDLELIPISSAEPPSHAEGELLLF